MTGVLVKTKSGVPETAGGGSGMPVLIARAGGNAEKRFLEFFAAQIRNRNTREAYLRGVDPTVVSPAAISPTENLRAKVSVRNTLPTVSFSGVD